MLSPCCSSEARPTVNSLEVLKGLIDCESGCYMLGSRVVDPTVEQTATSVTRSKYGKFVREKKMKNMYCTSSYESEAEEKRRTENTAGHFVDSGHQWAEMPLTQWYVKVTGARSYKIC